MNRTGVVVSEDRCSQMVRTQNPTQYIELRGGSMIKGAKRGSSVTIRWTGGRWVGVKINT